MDQDCHGERRFDCPSSWNLSSIHFGYVRLHQGKQVDCWYHHVKECQHHNQERWRRRPWFFLLLVVLTWLKGVKACPNVSSIVCRFWSLPWTNGSNTQLKCKLRHSPIHRSHLEPAVTHVSDRRHTRIGLNTELLMFALLCRLTRWCLEKYLAGA